MKTVITCEKTYHRVIDSKERTRNVKLVIMNNIMPRGYIVNLLF